ncbi:7,8-dihydro-8-oxoguanine triphosphatase-like isoform X2 [Varroa jacobsoni]|uniref:7,8-dihydro-8-oxoguanine triphosphatase-like isoform X2 n=1 Tax=Varroa jacobsoni TaxID=62625 RepID=UPI000BF8B4C5|nr:7,8-dihydro-8-oxoguanine triphosphatase-like isoform X2 [Varroa jacobsoni]
MCRQIRLQASCHTMSELSATRQIRVSPTAVRKLYTLFLVRKRDKVLLGMKKRGFGAGKWNGFGGKVDPGETIDQAAIRELKEESGLEVATFHKFAVITFEFVEGDHIMEGHIYTSNEPVGEPVETEEMLPQWYPINKVPFDKMWQDDKFWFPLWESGKRFVAYFKFQNNDILLDQTIREISDDSQKLEPMC